MKIEQLTIIGEKINYSIPRMKKILDTAVETGDFSSVQDVAKKQQEQGAAYLDVNVGTLPVEILVEVIGKVQEAVTIPLCIDEPNHEKMKAGLLKFL